MEHEIKALVVTDSNRNHTATAFVPGFAELPVPVTDNIYDYYLVDPDRAVLDPRLADTSKHPDNHPAQGAREVTLADARFADARTIGACVARDGGNWASIEKLARQGQFDNVHLAPRMRLAFDERTPFATGEVSMVVRTVRLEDIAMVFVCLHDCLHMHVRWAEFSTNKSARGFANGRPYSKSGVPAVPENQSVFASFPNAHTFNYRALAQEAPARRWQVFCHHGAGYPIDVWPTLEAAGKLFGLRASGLHSDSIKAQFARIHSQMPDDSWAAFYWRCRWTGKPGGPPVERLQVSLSRCLR